MPCCTRQTMRSRTARANLFVATALLVAAIASCGSSEADCPQNASECDPSCTALHAQPFDSAGACLRDEIVVGCQRSSAITGDARCAMRTSDGALFRGPSSAFASGYTSCGADLDQRAQSAPPCP